MTTISFITWFEGNLYPSVCTQLSGAKGCPLVCLEVTICRLPFPESGEPSPFPPNQVTPRRTMGETPQGPWQPFARHRESVIVYWHQSIYLNQIRMAFTITLVWTKVLDFEDNQLILGAMLTFAKPLDKTNLVGTDCGKFGGWQS